MPPLRNPKHVFYVYTLTDPRDGSVFYVGKGCGDRMHHHLREFRAGRILNGDKFARIADICAAGCEPVAEVIWAHLSEDDAIRLERKSIAEYGLDKLTNIAPGQLTGKERSTAWGNAMLTRLKSFEQWAAERPRTDVELNMARRVLNEFNAIAQGDSEIPPVSKTSNQGQISIGSL
jgi:hypothetical protein